MSRGELLLTLGLLLLALAGVIVLGATVVATGGRGLIPL